MALVDRDERHRQVVAAKGFPGCPGWKIGVSREGPVLSVWSSRRPGLRFTSTSQAGDVSCMEVSFFDVRYS